MVIIDEQSCIGCGACTDACQQHILYLDGGVCRVSEQEKCLKCKDCESVCPTEAIGVS